MVRVILRWLWSIFYLTGEPPYHVRSR
jgi:hypothetical protein